MGPPDFPRFGTCKGEFPPLHTRITPFSPTHLDVIEGKTQEKQMRLIFALVLLSSAVLTSGCVPLVIGAGGAVAADTIAEDRGTDLF